MRDSIRIGLPGAIRATLAVGIVTLILLSGPTTLIAQEPRTIPLDSLPSPSKERSEQIREWKVRLTTGVLPPSHPANRRGLSALTTYEIDFDYRCQPTWRFNRATGDLVIRPNFSRIRWKPKHTIWFRRPPATNKFWDDALVNHEFDHVQLSADPRMAKRFQDLLRSTRTFSSRVTGGQAVDRSLVDRLVQERVETIFKQTTDLIDIRYQELDRVTSSGRRPVPEDSDVKRWLTESKE